MNDFDIDKELDKNYSAADIDTSACYRIGKDIFVVSSIGRVPVEYCGVVGDQCFYFKSRGQIWQFVIAATLHDCLGGKNILSNKQIKFSCSGKYSEQEPNAGDMPTEQAEAIIQSCVALWKSGVEKENWRAREYFFEYFYRQLISLQQ